MDQDGQRRRLQRLASGRRAWHEQAPTATREARDSGLSISEIARLLDVSRAGVHDLLRRAGLAVLLAAVALTALPGAAEASERLAPGAQLPIACAAGEQPQVPFRPFVGGRWVLRYTGVSVSLTSDDDDGATWYIERHTHTYRARGEWAAQLVEHADGRVAVRNIGERALRFRYRC